MEAIRLGRLLNVLDAGRAGSERAAGPDAVDRIPPPRPFNAGRGLVLLRGSGPRCGTASWSPRAGSWCVSACGGTSPGPTSSRPRSTPSTATPATPGGRTGADPAVLRPAPGVAPGPVVALNRAVALAEVAGPVPHEWPSRAWGLENYCLFHGVRAGFLVRLGRPSEAAAAYRPALGAGRDRRPNAGCCKERLHNIGSGHGRRRLRDRARLRCIDLCFRCYLCFPPLR